MRILLFIKHVLLTSICAVGWWVTDWYMGPVADTHYGGEEW